MLGFKILRAGLGVGSLVMVLAGLSIAFQPQTVAVGEVKTGINAMVETGQFSATARKSVLPGLMLIWGGVAGLAIATLVNEPEPVVVSASGDTPITPTALKAKPKAVSRSHQQVWADSTLSELWANRVGFKQLAVQLDLPTRIVLFERSIQSHEGGWMKRLLRCPCLLVIGRPGSAKSSFAGALGMARELLIQDLRQTVVSDPNAHLKVEQSIWQHHWKLLGARDNWGDIGQAIADMYGRFADSQGANLVSSIYDEMTAYEGNVNEDHLGGFLPQITSKARAAKEYITIVSHNDTLKCLGGKAGEAKLKNDMVQLNLCSKSNDEGEFIPTGKGSIEGQDFDERNKPLTQPITVPRWFDPAILIRLFPEVYPVNSSVNESASEASPESYYHSTNGPLTEVTSEVAGKCPVSDVINDGSDHLEALSALTGLSAHIKDIYGVEVPVSALREVLTALENKQSITRISEEILGMKGRQFSKGKFIVQSIQDFVSSEDQD